MMCSCLCVLCVCVSTRACGGLGKEGDYEGTKVAVSWGGVIDRGYETGWSKWFWIAGGDSIRPRRVEAHAPSIPSS